MQEKVDTCINYTRPELAIALKQINNAILDVKGRSALLRYITEITKDNMS